MSFKSKISRDYMLVKGDLLDVTAWAIVIAENVTEENAQTEIDKYESETIGNCFLSELKDYENNYLPKEGQIQIIENVFLVSKKTLLNGADFWNYTVNDFLTEESIYIEDFASFDCKDCIVYKVKSGSDIFNFLHGNIDCLEIEKRPLTTID